MHHDARKFEKRERLSKRGGVSYSLEEFIDITNRAQTREELFVLYCAALKSLGYDRVVYTFITDHTQIGQKAGHGAQSCYPEDWMRHYATKNYYQIDPVPRYALRSSAPFSWEQIVRTQSLSKAQVNFMEEAQEAGLNDGIGVPLYGAMGEIAGVGLASSIGGIAPDRNLLSKIKLMTEQFHMSYGCLSIQQDKLESVRLTPTESEILKWWASGKTADEIATITSSSCRAIKWHISNIYAKLDANSKALAVVKAIRFGLIPLDVVKM
jgi:DNA-binding CsgD family transcriptional regulator